jgi:hypothetical protein
VRVLAGIANAPTPTRALAPGASCRRGRERSRPSASLPHVSDERLAVLVAGAGPARVDLG